MKSQYSTLDDGELIQLFIIEKDVQAYDALVRRYYDSLYGRFLVQVENSAEAEDLSQNLWIKVLNYLPNYQDENKFPHLLNKIATNLLRDRWQKNKQHHEYEHSEKSLTPHEFESTNPTEDHLIQQKKIQHLTETLIPQMPRHLRIAFLLKHESEYWDDKQPFRWEHLASLNNMDIETAGKNFQFARDKLMSHYYASTDEKVVDVSLDELEIFVLWTQAQRGNKRIKITENDLAKLMNLPLNTFKTHYRRAIEFLNQQLDKE